MLLRAVEAMTSRRRLFLALTGALAVAACVVEFKSGPRDGALAGDASVGTPADGSSPVTDGAPPMDAAPLSDAGLPPPPPTCKSEGLVCIPAAPAGWSGPFALYEGSVPSTPSCATGTTPVLTANADLVPSAPATCPACACGLAGGFTCGVAKGRGNLATCDCQFGSPFDVAPGVCTSTSSAICGGFQSNAVTIDPSPAVGGSCTPTFIKPTPSKTPPSWNVAALGCQLSVPSQVDCPAGNICAFRPAPPFFPGQCVMQAGDVPACPGFPYTKRRVFYRSANDTRDCTACSCGAPPPSNCTTQVKTTAEFDCSGAEPLTTAPTCRSTTNLRRFVLVNATPPANVACAPGGGAPTGNVATADAVTVCCAE